MAETPQEVPTAAQKRPLEEPSSPSGPTDQPDAKRPALDKVLKEESVAEVEPTSTVEDAAAAEDGATTAELALAAETKVEDDKSATVDPATAATDKQGDTDVPDAPTNGAASTLPAGLPAHSPVLSNGAAEGRAGSQGPMPYHQQDETGWLHVRAIITSAEAATVIGKGGENVTQIRRMAGAKCTVSEYSRGAVERILTVSGLVDAVAKV